MKRREFFKCTVGVAITLVLAKLSEAEPEVIGVDMATEEVDATVVSLHGMNAATPNDLGGFLIPQEYVDELMAAMKEEDRRNNVFRALSRTASFPTDPNLLVHRDFAEFPRAGAAVAAARATGDHISTERAIALATNYPPGGSGGPVDLRSFFRERK